MDSSTPYNIGLLVGAAIVAAICATVAGKKGHSAVLWGILGFMFGFIPLIIVLFLKDKNKEMANLNMPLPPNQYGNNQYGINQYNNQYGNQPNQNQNQNQYGGPYNQNR